MQAKTQPLAQQGANVADSARELAATSQIVKGSSVVGELDQAAMLQALDEQMSQEPELTEVEIFNRYIGIGT